MPGPLPKRIEERRRRNVVPGETTVVMDGVVEIPPARDDWHPTALAWYESLKDSGQSQFYEPSDWAQAVYAADLITKSLQPEATAAAAGMALAAMKELLTTESERRKAKLQVQRTNGGEPEAEKPTAIDEYRKMVTG